MRFFCAGFFGWYRDFDQRMKKLQAKTTLVRTSDKRYERTAQINIDPIRKPSNKIRSLLRINVHHRSKRLRRTS